MSIDPAPTPPPVSPLKYSTGEPEAKPGNGSGWILAISLLQLIGGVVMYGLAATSSGTNNAGTLAALIATTVLAAIFFGLWLWGRKSPFPALLTTLIVFVSFHLLEAVVDPLSIVRGIIMKIVILVGLSTAIKKAYFAKRQKELETPAS